MVQKSCYWLDLFSGTTWNEFLKAGADVSGFRESRWATLKRVKPGDYFICYLTGISRFIGLLEVISEPFQDKTPIWNDAVFPCRIKVKVVIQLTPETAIPVFDLQDQLSFFQDLSSPHAWTGHFRGSPMQWKEEDAVAVISAMHSAQENPVIRAVDPKKLAKRPQGLQSEVGPVVIPGKEETENLVEVPASEVRKHIEVQYNLLKLGHDMGFAVWVARNDRNREFKGKRFSEHFKFKENLPLQFDEPTTRTVELIDVLWLKGNAIVAAFEIESTTSIYSGLLRMSDLVAMQPNLNIPLYLVAPDEKREKVFIEINRPTFSRLNPPLSHVCRYISFGSLQEQLAKVQGFVKFLKPEFLIELSESCEVGD